MFIRLSPYSIALTALFFMSACSPSYPDVELHNATVHGAYNIEEIKIVSTDRENAFGVPAVTEEDAEVTRAHILETLPKKLPEKIAGKKADLEISLQSVNMNIGTMQTILLVIACIC